MPLEVTRFSWEPGPLLSLYGTQTYRLSCQRGLCAPGRLSQSYLLFCGESLGQPFQRSG